MDVITCEHHETMAREPHSTIPGAAGSNEQRTTRPGAGPVDLIAKNVISNISPDVASGKNKNTSDHTGVLFFPNAAHVRHPHWFFSLFRSGLGLGRTGTRAYSRATPPFRAEIARSTFMKRTSLAKLNAVTAHRHSVRTLSIPRSRN